MVSSDVELCALLDDPFDPDDLHPLLVFFVGRFPTQVAVVGREVNKLVVRSGGVLAVLNHQVALLEVGQNLVYGVCLRTFLTHPFGRRLGTVSFDGGMHLSYSLVEKADNFVDPSGCLGRKRFAETHSRSLFHRCIPKT